jgi:hypothetical protein
MASGHVYRVERPNTWPHRPRLLSEDSTCQPGAVHTWPNSDLSARLRQCPPSGPLRKCVTARLSHAPPNEPDDSHEAPHRRSARGFLIGLRS